MTDPSFNPLSPTDEWDGTIICTEYQRPCTIVTTGRCAYATEHEHA